MIGPRDLSPSRREHKSVRTTAMFGNVEDLAVLVFVRNRTQEISTLEIQDTTLPPVAYPGILSRGGVQQIQLRTEDRENGYMGAIAP